MTVLDDGFTLIEVMVATIIAGIIFGVLAQGVIIGFRTTDDTNKRIAGSNDTSLISNWFVPDVESAASVATSGAGGRYEAETYCSHTQPDVHTGTSWSNGTYVSSSGPTTTCTLPTISADLDTFRVQFVQRATTSYTGTVTVDGAPLSPNCSIPPGTGGITCAWSGLYPAGGHRVVVGTLDASPLTGVDYIEGVTCGVAGPALRLAWTDRATAVPNVVSYNLETASGENLLVRRHCTGGSATPTDQETVARGLASSPAPLLACQPAACSPTPVTVTVEFTEALYSHASVANTYRMSASTRTGS